MLEVMKAVDKANGYVYGQAENANMAAMMSTAVGADFDFFKYPCYWSCSEVFPEYCKPG